MKFLMILLFLSANIAQAGNEDTLIGGTPVQPGEFPEVVYISNGMARCSATVIGPRVIMTAGHCVKDGGTIHEVVHNQMVFKATCKQAPMYRDNTEDHDMALCKTDKEIQVKYAIISQKGPAIGDIVTLSGYGCLGRGPDGRAQGGNDGILRTGKAKVVKLPSGSYDWFDTKDTSALCFGDSGGPAFLKISSPKSEDHMVIGVNSRGDIHELSMLTALFIDKSQKFFKDFASEQAVQICGINMSCGQSHPKPEDKPKPACEKYAKKISKLLAKLDKYKAKYEQCQKSSSFEDAQDDNDEE